MKFFVSVSAVASIIPAIYGLTIKRVLYAELCWLLPYNISCSIQSRRLPAHRSQLVERNRALLSFHHPCGDSSSATPQMTPL
ncbi:hypothetical protein DFH07DRAFT_369855 [Mycena maculata]|uniref:Uncharacterized protein n=1 Tax=Mycena maculata TaxID=230809 RepID=A0AAD7JI88_9AGAR|nr:hypothetical protein DFH07DRAFT_369855 [Mycena maculata]